MFEPIKKPPNEFLGPAIGHGTEFGDNWTTAVDKINEGFAKVIAALRGGPIKAVQAEAGPVGESIDKRAREVIDDLYTRVQDMESKFAALMGPDAPASEQGVKVEEADAPGGPALMMGGGAGLKAVADALNIDEKPAA